MVELNNAEILNNKAIEYSHKPVAVLSPDDTLSHALGVMKEHDVFDLLVVKKYRVLGMISYDVLIKRKKLSLNTKVKDLMIHPPKLDVDSTLLDVAKAMVNSGFRTVPIIARNGTIKGVISRKDMIEIAIENDIFGDIKVDEVMSGLPVTVNEKDTIQHTRRIMANLQIRAIPVVNDKEKVVGVIGIRDIASALFVPNERATYGESAGEKKKSNLYVAGFMRSPAITLPTGSSVNDAIKLMLKYDISTIVIVDSQDKAAGVVTQIDLIEVMASQEAGTETEVLITGLEYVDPITASTLSEEINGFVEKMNRIIPIRRMNIYVNEYHAKVENEPPTFNFRTRVYTEHGMFYASSEGNEPHAVLNDMLEAIERQIKRYHDRLIDLKKKFGAESKKILKVGSRRLLEQVKWEIYREKGITPPEWINEDIIKE